MDRLFQESYVRPSGWSGGADQDGDRTAVLLAED
jgi:hypothetical protein